MQHSDPPSQQLDYAVQSPRIPWRRFLRRALPVLTILTLPVVIWVVTMIYIEGRFRALTPGMTRAQVDQQLWAFRRYPNPKYQGLWPGQFVMRYELFRMGKATMIQIIFNADGTVASAQPIYGI